MSLLVDVSAVVHEFHLDEWLCHETFSEHHKVLQWLTVHCKMIAHYLKRGYPFKQLKKRYILRARKFSQYDLLEVKTKEPVTTPVLTKKYSPQNPNIKNLIHNNWNIIQHSNDCASTFPDKAIIAFKRLPNLRDILTKASISYPQKEMEAKSPIIKKLDEITCKISGNTYKPKYLPKHLSCELSDIVYLITCKECKNYYVGETGRAFRARIYEHKLSVIEPKHSRVTPVSKHFTGKKTLC